MDVEVSNDTNWEDCLKTRDKLSEIGGRWFIRFKGNKKVESGGTRTYAVRPTNTSVLYCIKY